jgi:hypothetical protein
LWDRLSEGGQIEQCGWLKDRYGASWQIVPAVLEEVLKDRDTRRTESVFRALVHIKKLDIECLKHMRCIESCYCPSLGSFFFAAAITMHIFFAVRQYCR